LSVVDQFKEISLSESLLNFQKDACNICHISSECYHFTFQYGKQCKGASDSEVVQITESNTVIGTCIE